VSKRLTVPKTYKLFIGGAFPRTESGRTYEVVSSKGDFLANAALASRKDARDAVLAARGAVKGWVDEAIDRWVWYAGWCDKFGQVAGNGNPVAGPYFNISVPEPTGVVAVIAPQDTALLGLVSAIAPALVSGNAVVVVASQRFPLSAISLAEVLATSDVPGGVVNVLTGSPGELAPWLASHPDVHGLDLVGAGDLDWVDLQIAAAETLTRVLPPESGKDAAAPSLERIAAFTETKTVWHTKSLV
jgi:acyl-CoA reductase-like NAD-dependent aldehyde dehydrogenase